MEYITGKEAQLILGITTRQGLNKVLQGKDVEIKKQGRPNPNLYLKSDIERIEKETREARKKNLPKKTKKKAQKKKERVEEKKEKNTQIVKRGSLDVDPLNDVGKGVFFELKKELKDKGIFDNVDAGMLQAYCISYQKYVNAVNQSAEFLDISIDSLGNEKIHPYFQIADKALSQMIKIGTVLGIGVKNRVNLDIKEPKKDTIFDVLNTKEEF